MSFFSVSHVSRAIQLRTSLIKEVQKAKRRGHKVPPGLIGKIWKEPHVQEDYIWLLRFIETGEKVTLIDIGGNSGEWAENFTTYYPHTEIYAFEPVGEMYKRYTTRFANNPSVTVFNTALGERKEEKNINVAEGYGLSSFHTYEGNLMDKNSNFTREEKVSVNRLDTYLDKIKFQKVVIKVDVQGFELDVIRGGMQVFQKADVVVIECSFINEFKQQLPTFGEIVHLFRPLDLHPIDFGVYDRTKGPLAYERNVLFVKSKYFQQIWDK